MVQTFRDGASIPEDSPKPEQGQISLRELDNLNSLLLSVAIPAYNRPAWFERALKSVVSTPLAAQQQVEIIVSDDSTSPDCKAVFEVCMTDWHGPHHYQANVPSLGMAANWNNCIRLASGKYLLILHDDDYLEPNAVSQIFKAIQQFSDYGALLFGVNVVTSKGRIKKRQHFRQRQYLSREAALKAVLYNSSFVRFPGIVLRHDVFEQVGYFDGSVGGIADIHLWVRVFNTFGVLCLPMTTANYTVHPNALTMNMFNEAVLQELVTLFDWVESQQWFDSETFEYCKANYFHQFILAGTVRYLRLGKLRQAKQVLNLFGELDIQRKRTDRKWKLIRLVLSSVL